MFRLQTQDRGVHWRWSRSDGGMSWSQQCCRRPVPLHCGLGRPLSLENVVRWWVCPPCYARQNNLCQNRGDSRTYRCSPASKGGPCLCGWCPCRRLQQRIPRSTRSPNRSGHQTEPHGTAPGQMCQTAPDYQSRAAGCGFESPSCCSLTGRALCRLCWHPTGADRSLKVSRREFNHFHLLRISTSTSMTWMLWVLFWDENHQDVWKNSFRKS